MSHLIRRLQRSKKLFAARTRMRESRVEEAGHIVGGGRTHLIVIGFCGQSWGQEWCGVVEKQTISQFFVTENVLKTVNNIKTKPEHCAGKTNRGLRCVIIQLRCEYISSVRT